MAFALALLFAAPPAIVLQWPAGACPARKALVEALHTYGLGVDSTASVKMIGARVRGNVYRLTLEARGTRSLREVEVPAACADRAAVIAVVIDALVAPFFWPSGRPSSRPSSAPVKSALDFILASSEPATEPTSEPASIAASEPTSEPASIPATESVGVPMVAYVLGGVDLWTNERPRGRVGLGYAVRIPMRVRWFIEASFLSLRRAFHDPGQIDYGEGVLTLGGDVSILAGWFAGAGVGLQLIYAVASGFDANRSAFVLGPTVEARSGYRHLFADHFELGGHVLFRADLFRQRLLVDDLVVAQLSPLHVGVVVTGAFVW